MEEGIAYEFVEGYPGAFPPTIKIIVRKWDRLPDTQTGLGGEDDAVRTGSVTMCVPFLIKLATEAISSKMHKLKSDEVRDILEAIAEAMSDSGARP